MSEDKETHEEIQRLLKQVVDHFDLEDKSVRERQIRIWKKLKFYWNGFQHLWWQDTAHDWRVFGQEYANNSSAGSDAAYYDKPINIFRAYLESIIAALSVAVPSIKCYPDDADNPLDISTAKAGDKISQLIDSHNDSILLWIHALYIYCTEGAIYAYNYTKEDEKFGTYDDNKYEDTEEDKIVSVCPLCNTQMGDAALTANERDEFDPGDDDVISHDILNNSNKPICESCLQAVDPELKSTKIIVTRLIGSTKEPKTRQIIECYGGLYVKTPNYALKQEDFPYLHFCYETHYSNVLARYPQLRKKYKESAMESMTSSDSYARWGRLSTQYNGDYPINTPTVRNCWHRVSSFEVLNDEDDVKKLKKLYPDGVKVVFINEEFAEAVNESLDDHWTVTKNPLSDYVQHDPLGLLLTSVQDITNELISLTLQTVEHGIPQTFADTKVLNFEQYRNTEVSPGSVYPATPHTGKSLNDGFATLKTASLSPEVLPFGQKIQEMGQLTSGALPSLFGGAAPNSSKTAAQYAMSRAQALQRLQTPWKMLTMWWKEVHGKAIPAFIKEMVEDERYVDKDDNGNFLNVFIKKAETAGKIGSVELEASEELPISWSQKRDVIMNLMQAANPEVMAILGDPQNIPFISNALGLNNLEIPGEDDRTKQYEEIQLLLASQPIPDMEPGAMGQLAPSVDVDPMVDNHTVEADICRRWAVSEAGRQAKVDNPPGYQNVLLHMKRHMDLQQAMNAPVPNQQQVNPAPQGAQPNNNKKPAMAPANAGKNNNGTQQPTVQ